MTEPTDPNQERLDADAEGHDIVGLKKGERFDPLGDMRRMLEERLKEDALKSGTSSAPPAAPKPEPQD